MAQDHMHVSIAKGEAFERGEPTDVKVIGISRLRDHLAGELGADLIEMDASLVEEVNEAATNYSTDPLWPRYKEVEILDFFVHRLNLQHRFGVAMCNLADHLEEIMGELEKAEPTDEPPFADRLGFLFGYYDGLSFVLAGDCGVVHPRHKNERWVEVTAATTPPDKQFLYATKDHVMDPEDDAKILSMLGADDAAKYLAVPNMAKQIAEKSEDFLERRRTIMKRWSEHIVPRVQELESSLSTLMGGKLEPEWRELYQFIQFGPQDGIHELKFPIPSKDNGKLIARSARAIYRLSNGHPEGEQAAITEALADEASVVELCRFFAQFDPGIHVPKPEFRTSLVWLAEHADSLLSSGILHSISADARSKLDTVLRVCKLRRGGV